MKVIRHRLFTFAAITLGMLLVANSAASAANSQGASITSRAPTSAKATPEVQKQRAEAQRAGDKSIDKDAVAAINEAQTALKAIAGGHSDQAIAAIERATGKINILTARNPAAALIPVHAEVDIVDHAPKESKAIHELTSAAEKAVSNGDYPRARTLLDQLASEIRVRTYHLPLGTYPAAMQEAARLLDQKKIQDAKTVLLAALNTLVVTGQDIPLPVTLARSAVQDAQAERNKDKAAAQKFLASAKANLERAKTLGYESQAPEYAALSQSITELDRQLNGKEDSASAFAALKEKLDAFFDRLTNKPPTSQSAKTAQS